MLFLSYKQFYMKKILLFLFTAVSPALFGQVMTVTVDQDAFSVCPSDVVDVNATRSTPLNNSLSLNGFSQYLEIPNSTATNLGTSSFSLEFWVKLNALSGLTYLASNRNAAGVGWAVFVDGSGYVGFGVRDAAGSFDVQSGTISSINDGNWHHIAVTWDRGSTVMNLYIDGGFETTDNMAVGDVGTAASTTVGYGVSPSSGNATYLNGGIDEFRFWSEPRSSGDIQTYMSAHLNPTSFTTLVQNFDFNELTVLDGWFDCAGSVTITSGVNSPSVDLAGGPLMIFNFSMNWLTSSGLSQNGSNFQETFNADDTVFVTTGYCKYEAMDTVFVTALDCDTAQDPRDAAAVFTPTAFTPNGDTKNDYYLVKVNAISYFEMQVYNRLGNILFYSKDVNTGWDGTFENKTCYEGVYIAKILYRDLEGTEFIKYQQFSLMR
jgi:gliding motility-associated-like protein